MNKLGRLAARLTLVVTLMTALTAVAAAQELADLTRAYLGNRSKANKQALLDYAEQHNDYTSALAKLVVGATVIDQDRGWEEGRQLLADAAPQLVRLRDYVGYYSAKALYETHQDPEAIRALDPVINDVPPSSLRPDAVMLAATIYYENDEPSQTITLIKTFQDELPAAPSLSLLADAQVKSNLLADAVANYRKIYYGYPTADEADTAYSQLSVVRRAMGDEYPDVDPSLRFERIDKLIEAGEHQEARSELQDMTTQLSGVDRERARVWLGKARYLRRNDSVAYTWLNSLGVSDPNEDAERLYWLVEASRRMGRRTTVNRVIERLEKEHPDSGWRMQALISAGNMYLIDNNQDAYVPLFAACAETFSPLPRAAYCNWKVAWSTYMRRQPEAAELFRKHIATFPGDEYVPVALYFLGRLAERDGKPGEAKAWYEQITADFPGHYYTELAGERLADQSVADATASESVQQFLAGIRFPDKRRTIDFTENAVSQYREARAQLLTTAGLYEWAEKDLYYAARTEGNGPVLALELARLAARRDDYGQSIRYIKALAPGYLNVPEDGALDTFWRLTFPLPYREQMERYTKERNLDLYLMAAMIRQESEFDTQARSSAGALGLTQVLPATARGLYRQLGYNSYSRSMLFDPAVNLDMGTYLFREWTDKLDGHVEATLAAYNAGLTRAEAWLKWGDFQEPAEFIETIPFTETRNHVRAVLRNEFIYRRIYQ